MYFRLSRNDIIALQTNFGYKISDLNEILKI